jgi:hypothetical protein
MLQLIELIRIFLNVNSDFFLKKDNLLSGCATVLPLLLQRKRKKSVDRARLFLIIIAKKIKAS